MESSSPTIEVTALGRFTPNTYVNFEQSSPDVCTSGFSQPSPASSPRPAIGGSSELSWPCSAGPRPLAPHHLGPSLKPRPPLLPRWKRPLRLRWWPEAGTTEDMGYKGTGVSSSCGVKRPHMYHYSRDEGRGQRKRGDLRGGSSSSLTKQNHPKAPQPTATLKINQVETSS